MYDKESSSHLINPSQTWSAIGQKGLFVKQVQLMKSWYMVRNLFYFRQDKQTMRSNNCKNKIVATTQLCSAAGYPGPGLSVRYTMAIACVYRRDFYYRHGNWQTYCCFHNNCCVNVYEKNSKYNHRVITRFYIRLMFVTTMPRFFKRKHEP